jgi:integral membrane sensor domain MASE1
VPTTNYTIAPTDPTFHQWMDLSKTGMLDACILLGLLLILILFLIFSLSFPFSFLFLCFLFLVDIVDVSKPTLSQ